METSTHAQTSFPAFLALLRPCLKASPVFAVVSALWCLILTGRAMSHLSGFCRRIVQLGLQPKCRLTHSECPRQRNLSPPVSWAHLTGRTHRVGSPGSAKLRHGVTRPLGRKEQTAGAGVVFWWGVVEGSLRAPWLGPRGVRAGLWEGRDLHVTLGGHEVRGPDSCSPFILYPI